ncbi:MAG: SAM-dependent methyltransferase, partial [Verrucomicrobiales bacterium]
DSRWVYNDKLYRRHYCLELVGEGNGVVLDLGCGAGPYVKSLNRLGHQVVAMDAANEMVALASEEAAKLDGNGWALRGDALNLPFAENTFDSVLAVGLLEYLPDDEEFLTKIGKILKLGGRAVVTLRNERCATSAAWSDVSGGFTRNLASRLILLITGIAITTRLISAHCYGSLDSRTSNTA